MLKPSIEERFWAKVNFDGPNGCWLWTASLRDWGYGQFNVRPKMWKAHRLSYVLLVGAIPCDLELDHLCRTPACVNPDHLEPVTHHENIMRGEWPSAKHARKTHCAHGHPFDEENTYSPPAFPNRRYCRICSWNKARSPQRRAYAAAYRNRKRQEKRETAPVS